MKKSLKVTILVTFIVLLLVAPVSAPLPMRLRAWGRLSNYAYAEGVSQTAEVLGGTWYCSVTGDYAHFYASYNELNLHEDEGSPVGSVDMFWIRLVDTLEVNYNTEAVEIVGWFEIMKRWVTLPDGEIVWLNPFWEGEGTVTINPDMCNIFLFDEAVIQGQTWMYRMI